MIVLYLIVYLDLYIYTYIKKDKKKIKKGENKKRIVPHWMADDLKTKSDWL